MKSLARHEKKAFEAFYQRFLSLTKEQGHYESAHREAVLRALFFSDTHLSAEEIAKEIRKSSKISLPAVYNTLSFLEEMGLLHVFILPPYTLKTYRLLLEYQDQLVCIKCGKIVPFHDKELQMRERAILDTHAFTGINQTIILYGVCNTCQEKGTSPSS